MKLLSLFEQISFGIVVEQRLKCRAMYCTITNHTNYHQLLDVSPLLIQKTSESKNPHKSFGCLHTTDGFVVIETIIFIKWHTNWWLRHFSLFLLNTLLMVSHRRPCFTYTIYHGEQDRDIWLSKTSTNAAMLMFFSLHAFDSRPKLRLICNKPINEIAKRRLHQCVY